MNDLGSTTAGTYALSLTYDKLAKGQKANGILVALNSTGTWVNAVSMNAGGKQRFVSGPWKSTYALGTYGIDTRRRTAWAVIDYGGSFAVARR